jgi:hypothetical protein
MWSKNVFLVIFNFFLSSTFYIWELIQGGTVISVLLSFACCLRERETTHSDDRLQPYKTEKETGASTVGLNVVFPFSNSLRLKLQFPLSSVRYEK